MYIRRSFQDVFQYFPTEPFKEVRIWTFFERFFLVHVPTGSGQLPLNNFPLDNFFHDNCPLWNSTRGNCLPGIFFPPNNYLRIVPPGQLPHKQLPPMKFPKVNCPVWLLPRRFSPEWLHPGQLPPKQLPLMKFLSGQVPTNFCQGQLSVDNFSLNISIKFPLDSWPFHGSFCGFLYFMKYFGCEYLAKYNKVQICVQIAHFVQSHIDYHTFKILVFLRFCKKHIK